MENSSDISVDTAGLTPEKDGKPNLIFWKARLEAFDNMAKPWHSDVDEAYDEYMNQSGAAVAGRAQSSSNRSSGTHYPIFWSAVRTIQPAFYSRTPVIVTEKSFKEMRDPVARLAAVMLERLGKYAVRTSAFDRAMIAAVTQFIMSEKTTLRVIFEAGFKQEETRSYLSPVMMPYEGADNQMMISTAYVDDDGAEFEGEPDQDEQGRYFSSGLQEVVDYMRCDTEVPHYKDMRHTPNARHWGEIDWISFDSQLTRTEFEETFGEEVAREVTFSSQADHKDKHRKREVKGLPDQFAVVTEIWDKRKKRIYYLTPGYGQWLTHKNNPKGEDPYKLRCFFPVAPFLLGTIGPNDLFSSPAYVQLKDFIDQVHAAFDRLRRLILAMKKTGVYDASKPGLSEINSSTSEGQFIGVEDLGSLLGPNGDLDRVIKFFPTDQIAKGVVDLKTAIVDFENKFYDLWGIPDIYRGITDPNETLGAQQMKGKHMSVRFSQLQREVQRLARDTIEIMCDMYLAMCPNAQLAEYVGYQFMTPEEQQLFPQALQLLKDDTERTIRVEIETDSTITQNINADIEQKNYLAKTLMDGFAAVATASQQNPMFGIAAMQVVALVVRGLEKGKEIEDVFEQLIQSMQQQAQQPAPPDPKLQIEQMKQQGKMQELQMHGQLKQQELQGKAQIEQIQAQADIASNTAKTQADIARENVKAQSKMAIEERMAMMEAQLMQMRAHLEAQTHLVSTAADMGVKKFDAQQAAKLQAKQAERAFTESPPGDTVNIHISNPKP